MTRKMTGQTKQPEERLSEALRHLGQTVDRSAPPEIYSALAGAFRSHHIRRRRTQRTRIVLASVACLVLSVALLRAIRSPVHAPVTNAGNRAVHLIPPQNTEFAGEEKVAQASHRENAGLNASGRARKTATVEDFLALPSYDPTVATDGLRIVRLEARGSDIRLAGAPVSEELSERRVVADFVVGHDGTPYAVRFVQ
ncbi:MAG TPA: hypothetical protein VNV88_04670 [Candidatus Solibacter sp.]|nr:hypothetical protein [Candidatus Solibacter sp.]